MEDANIEDGINAKETELVVPGDEDAVEEVGVEADEVEEEEATEASALDIAATAVAEGVGAHIEFLKSHVNSDNPFEPWTRFELLQGLVVNNIEIRNANKVTDNNLRRMMQELYQGKEIPARPEKPDMETFKVVDICARRVQKRWRYKKMMRRWRFVQDGIKKRLDEMHKSAPAHEGAKPLQSRSTKANVEWVPPDVEEAEHFAELNMVREGGPGGKPYDLFSTQTGRHCNMSGFGEQCDLWNEGKWSDLSPYGPGLTNFFKFLKWGYWLLFFVFVIMFPTILISLNGTVMPNDVTTMESVLRLSVGNLGDTVEATALGVKIPGCQDSSYNLDCYMEKSEAAVIYGNLNLLAMLLVLVAIWWLFVFEKKEERLDDYSLFASAYTVEVRGLPLTATEDSLKEHFERVMEGDKVAEVYFAFDNEAQIYEYKARGIVKDKAERSRVERMYAQYKAKESGGEISEEVKEQLQASELERKRELIAIDEEIKLRREEANERNSKLNIDGVTLEHGRPVRGFVTFQDIHSAKICQQLYPNTLWSNICPKEELLYHGHVLGVRQAPEPSTIIWENLHYNWVSRLWRVTVTTTVMVGLIILTVVVAFAARVVQQSVKETGGTDECPINFANLSADEQLEAVEANEEILHCYCDSGGLEDEDECGKYHEIQAWGSFVVLLSSAVVTMLNMGLEYIIDIFADFEKPDSLEDREMSIFLRLFVYKYINMGLIFLINEDRIGVASTLNMSYDAKADFTVEWYQTVGVMLVFVQLSDIFVSHGFKYYTYFIGWWDREAAKKNAMLALTQEELNHKYLGPEFRMSYEYAALCTTFFVALTFSSVIPLMALLGSLNFLVTYWVDKYFFVRLYRAPPRYNTNLNHFVTSMLPVAVLINLGIAIWAYGNNDIFSSSSSVDDGQDDDVTADYNVSNAGGTVTKDQNIGAFVLFVLLVSIMSAYQIVKSFGGALTVVFMQTFGDLYASMMLNFLKLDVNHGLKLEFHTAVACGRFKNLFSYNMMHNPLYMEALHITKDFADTHRYITSIDDDHEKVGTRTSMTGAEMAELRAAAISNARISGALEGLDDIDERSDGDNDVDEEARLNKYVWKDIMDQERESLSKR